jgi:hypothetical protein
MALASLLWQYGFPFFLFSRKFKDAIIAKYAQNNLSTDL